MGKGKAKGWRPPAAGASGGCLLLGSANHLTGDTIASPVQLREEGRAIPQGHPNYPGPHSQSKNPTKTAAKQLPGQDATHRKDEFGSQSASSSNDSAVPAAKVVAKPLLPASAKQHGTAYPRGVTCVGTHPSNTSDGNVQCLEVDTFHDDQKLCLAKTEIEKRREAMLEREKRAKQTYGVAACMPSDADERRKALDMRRCEAEARAREAEFRRCEFLTKDHPGTADRYQFQSPTHEGDGYEFPAKKTISSNEDLKTMNDCDHVRLEAQQSIQRPAEHGINYMKTFQPQPSSSLNQIGAPSEKMKIHNVDAHVSQDAKRQCVRDKTEDNNGPQSAQISQPTGNAIEQGLQQWAARVNSQFDDDSELSKKCREFVRRRILKAHADGNLHSISWIKEPLPSLEDLR